MQYKRTSKKDVCMMYVQTYVTTI